MKKFLWIGVLLALSASLHAQPTLFGLTREGGLNGGGTLFSLDTAGTNYKLLRSFGRPEHSPDNNDVIDGGDGYLYGTISSGGMYNAGAIFKTRKDGTGYALIHTFNDIGGKTPAGHLELADGFLYGTTRAGGFDEQGTIFKVKTDGTSFSVIYSFVGTTGRAPQSGVVLSNNGVLYGVAPEGGTYEQGTIFSIHTDGTGFTVLHDFNVREKALAYGRLYQASNNTLYGLASTQDDSKGFLYSINPDGSEYTTRYTFTSNAEPRGSVIEQADGYLYGVTAYFIFRIKPDGTEFQNLKTFDGRGGNIGIGALMPATNGYLYGVTREGGVTHQGAIFRIKPDGSDFQAVVDFTSDGLNPTGTAVLSDNTIYGMTNLGGAGASGVLYKCETTNGQLSIVHNFAASDINGQTPAHLIAGPNNTLYGVTSDGGTGYSGTIFKVNFDGTGYSVIHNFGLIPDDGLSPNGLIYASNGYLYGTTAKGGGGDNEGMGILYRIKPTGADFEIIHTWVGSNGANPTGGLLEWNNKLWIVTEEGGAENAGTIHALSLTDTAPYGVYDFAPSNGTDGSRPTGRLLAGSDGYLYGVTRRGGPEDRGTLFRLAIQASSATSKTLFNFTVQTGNIPTGSLIETADGYLNGTTTRGSINGTGELFKIKKDGTGFQSVDFFHQPPHDMAVDQLTMSADGKRFGVLTTDREDDAGVLYAINANSTQLIEKYAFQFGTGSTPVAVTLAETKAIPTAPELEVAIDNTPTANGGKKDFLTITVLASTDPSTVTLRNTGTSELILKGNPKVAITGSQDFTIDQSTLPNTIAAGASASFTVTFRPQTIGTKTATLTIANNDSDEGSFIINLVGASIKQIQTIDFTAPTAKTYGGEDFVLQAKTTANLLITFTSADPSIASINGNTVTIKKAGIVNITASQGGNALVAAAPSVTQALVINKATQTIQFAVLPGKRTGDAPFTLTATATSNLPVTFSSANPEIAAIKDNTVTLLAEGRAEITAIQNGNENYQAAPPIVRTLIISAVAIVMDIPASIDFGEVNIGESEQRPLTIRNTGEGPLEVASITLPQGFTIAAPSTGIFIAKGASTELPVIFTPTEAITYTGEATVYANVSADDRRSITLTGRGANITSIYDPAIATPTIYPNPSTGHYTITTTQSLNTTNTQLLSTVGATLPNTIALITATQPNANPHTQTYQLDLTPHPAGIYLLLIQTTPTTPPQTLRLIKQ